MFRGCWGHWRLSPDRMDKSTPRSIKFPLGSPPLNVGIELWGWGTPEWCLCRGKSVWGWLRLYLPVCGERCMWFHASGSLETVLKIQKLPQDVCVCVVCGQKDPSGGLTWMTLQPQFRFPCFRSEANMHWCFCWGIQSCHLSDDWDPSTRPFLSNFCTKMSSCMIILLGWMFTID